MLKKGRKKYKHSWEPLLEVVSKEEAAVPIPGWLVIHRKEILQGINSYKFP